MTRKPTNALLRLPTLMRRCLTLKVDKYTTGTAMMVSRNVGKAVASVITTRSTSSRSSLAAEVTSEVLASDEGPIWNCASAFR